MRIQFDLSSKSKWKRKLKRWHTVSTKTLQRAALQVEVPTVSGAARPDSWCLRVLHLCAAAITQSMSRSIVAAIEQLSYANLHLIRPPPKSISSPPLSLSQSLCSPDSRTAWKTHLSSICSSAQRAWLANFCLSGKGACQLLSVCHICSKTEVQTWVALSRNYQRTQREQEKVDGGREREVGAVRQEEHAKIDSYAVIYNFATTFSPEFHLRKCNFFQNLQMHKKNLKEAKNAVSQNPRAGA